MASAAIPDIVRSGPDRPPSRRRPKAASGPARPRSLTPPFGGASTTRDRTAGRSAADPSPGAHLARRPLPRGTVAVPGCGRGTTRGCWRVGDTERSASISSQRSFAPYVLLVPIVGGVFACVWLGESVGLVSAAGAMLTL